MWSASCAILREGMLSFHHYDFYAQCLAKIERGHRKDEADVQAMLQQGVVERERLQQLFDAIRPQLFRFPAIDPSDFAARVRVILLA